MNRRDFFRLKTGRRPLLEVDCERLYMHYIDSRTEGQSEQLLRRLVERLREVSAIRLKGAFWLSASELKNAVTPLLDEFHSRGGTIEYR